MRTMYRWDPGVIRCGWTASDTWKCAKTGQEAARPGAEDPDRCPGCDGLTNPPKPPEPEVPE